MKNKESIKCPVCGKDGIPDFHNEDVVCPCCSSDLSVYHKLHMLSMNNSETQAQVHKKKWLMPTCTVVVVMLAISLAYVVASSQHRSSVAVEEINRLHKEVSLLNDSLAMWKKKYIYLQKGKEQCNGSNKFYVVRNGDSFCRISRALYGTETRYIDIARFNGLNVKEILHEGDTLKYK